MYLACLWTLLRRKTGAFAMSFGRVCGIKRVFAALFRRKTERVCDVFAVFMFIVQLVEGYFCLLNGGRLSCTWCVCGHFCNAKRTLLQCLSSVYARKKEAYFYCCVLAT